MKASDRCSRTRTRPAIGGLVTLVALIVGVALLFEGDIAQATFEITDEGSLSNYGTGANADVTSLFSIDAPHQNFSDVVEFTPSDWKIASDADVPNGAIVGFLSSESTLGLFNNPCESSIVVQFQFQDAATDIDDCFTYEVASEPVSKPNWPGYEIMPSGLMRAVEQYPCFLNDLFNHTQPLSRSFAVNTSASPGTSIPLQFVVFPPGSLGYPASRGYPAATILNDPSSFQGANPITDFCTPLSSNNVSYGLTKDNPVTAANEGGIALRTNPCAPGDYTFSTHAVSKRDADGDGMENYLDTCPQNADPAGCDSRLGNCDGDGDGITTVCDVDISEDPNDGINDNHMDALPLGNDADKDGYMNRLDICPQVANGVLQKDVPNVGNQLDTDKDDIGDACDNNRTSADGAANVQDKYRTTTITGDNVCQAAEATPTPTATATAAATATATAGAGTPTVQAETPTPTVVEGEICSPVFPGTYNGRVLIDGKPAASGYQLTASIGDVQWGSATISGGRYAMDIPDHMPTAKPCFEGGTITFALNGMTCTPVEQGADVWKAGIRNVDLDCAPVAPPVTPTVAPPPATPTAKATPPVTPTPKATPTTVPPTGAGGLSGSGSGLPLWATALAGWVGLMTIAGLGTVVAAKRR